MQDAETVLNVLRERGRRGLPCTELYRQLFNPSLFELAHGRIYANHGAMTPGADGETADGMSLARTMRIIDALRHERYRFQPVKRTWIPKKNGKLSLDPPANSGRSFPAPFLHEEFSEVNPGASVLPLACSAACPGSWPRGRGFWWP